MVILHESFSGNILPWDSLQCYGANFPFLWLFKVLIFFLWFSSFTLFVYDSVPQGFICTAIVTSLSPLPTPCPHLQHIILLMVPAILHPGLLTLGFNPYFSWLLATSSGLSLRKCMLDIYKIAFIPPPKSFFLFFLPLLMALCHPGQAV